MHLRENQALLIWRDAFFVLNFLFHVLNGIARFDVERNGFAGQCLDENLHGEWRRVVALLLLIFVLILV